MMYDSPQPSAPAAYLFLVLFGILAILHLFQLFQYRTWHMATLVIVVLMECAGHAARVVSLQQSNIIISAFVSQIITLFAPALAVAQVYIIAGRIMAYVGSEYGVTKRINITTIFVSVDIVAMLLQGIGTGLFAGPVLVAGLSVQLVAYGVFLFLAIKFHVNSRNSLTLKAYWGEMRQIDRLWVAIYVSGVLIAARTIYRAIVWGGPDFILFYLLTLEWPFYLFDAMPMFLAILALNIAHPGMYLPRHKDKRIGGGWKPLPSHGRFLCFGRRSYPPKPRQGTTESQTYLMTDKFAATLNTTNDRTSEP